MTQLTVPEARAMIAVVNTRNVDKVLDQYAEDASFQVPTQEAPIRGKDAIRAFLTGNYAAFPDWTIDVQQIAVEGNHTYVVGSVRGTHDGPLVGQDGKVVAPTHKRVVQEQMTHLVFNENGKVSSLRAYGNPAELYQQLGLAPKAL